MYRCGSKVELGDCVTVNVSVMVTEIVLETNLEWSSTKRPLLTLLFPDESIQQLPASWCTLCQRK